MLSCALRDPHACLSCGEALRDLKRKFCSCKCFFAHQTRESLKLRIERLCLNCSRSMLLQRNQVQAIRGKFCSRACFYTYKRRELTCAQCKAQFIVRAKRLRHKNGPPKYCSQKCHGDAIRLHDREWRRNYLRARAVIRRVRQQAAQGRYNADDIELLFKRQKGRCGWCRAKLNRTKPRATHVDHVIPLTKGGSNKRSNLLLACRSCNSHKSNKMPEIWAREIGLLL